MRSEPTIERPPIEDAGVRIAVFCWVSALVSGAVYFWHFRNVFDMDEISYLDIAEAYLRGDWTNAINSYWSPLYSWVLAAGMALLRPSPKWEFLFLGLVAFLFYLASLWAFHTFWRQIDGYTDAAFTLFGYSLFQWVAMAIVRSEAFQPDIGAMAIVFSVAAQYLRIERTHNVRRAVLVGTTLAFGYFLKAALFPLALVFFVLIYCTTRSKRVTAAALGTFILVSAPWVIGLSISKHRLTYGDTGALNYAFYANDVSMPAGGDSEIPGWYGGPGDSGSPVHPPTLLHLQPRVMDYATPVAGTYPISYDPSFWYEGVHLYFNPRYQMAAIVKSLRFYWKLFLGIDPDSKTGPIGALLGGCIALAVAAGKRLRMNSSLLLLWTLAAFALYGLVHVELRYVGGFVVLFWAIVYRAFREGAQQEIRTPVMLVVAIALGCCVVMPMPGFVIQSVRDIATGRTEPDQYEVAHELSTMGIGAGDRIASIGSPFESIFFARLGKLKFVAQVMDDDVGLFWGLDKQSMAEVFRSLATTGARAVIAKDVPGPERSDWNRLGNSGFYVHFLNETPPRKHP